MNSKNNSMSLTSYVLSTVLVSVIAFFGLILMGVLIRDGLIPLASLTGGVVIFFSLVFLRKKFSPYRWMAVSIIFVLLFTIYPIVSTVFISFSNMSGGHLITKQQSIHRLESKMFLPQGARTFSWTAYRKGTDSYLLLLEDNNGEYFIAEPGKALKRIDNKDKPKFIYEFIQLTKKDVIPVIETLGLISFGKKDSPVTIQSLHKASELQHQYSYSSGFDSITDKETGIEYKPVNGTFTSDSGEKLVPGFKINTGFSNYTRFISNPGYRKPIVSIIIWNISFAFFSVLLSFLLGMTIALIFENVPGKGIIRTLLLIPYPIPVLVSITVWRGLLNESMGFITQFLQNIFGTAPHFFTDATWTRIALILINVYLSYPYFYILSSGALRSIPGSLFEAAEIDGAGSFNKLRLITMPLILRILMPLLIASFSFNFNNFTLIWGFNAGLPAISNSIVPMGHTDLLISFIYRLAFSTANVSNYGFAAAITVLLFLFVSSMVLFQIHSTKALKEYG